jgi:DNA (cytosine-5)-methyltransferase 1
MGNFTHLGLFEGIGGFSLAARWMGWETVAWCEWDKNCQRVLKYHFPNANAHDDITKTDFTRYAGQIDILTGGFPCQPYSTAGKRLGKEDDRHLWPEMLRAIREVRPRWVVGENVRGLVSWNGGLVFDEVQTDLEAEGYEVWAFLLPACAVDAPHRRDRVWFVAHTNSSRGEKSKLQLPNLYSRPGICNKQTTTNAGGTGRQKLDTPAKPGFAEHSSGCNNSDAANAEIERLSQWNGEQAREQEANSTTKRHGCIPKWSNFPTQSPVCSRNDGFPRGLDGIAFSKWREFSIGAYGNAIVPQVAYQIFKAVEQWEISKDGQPIK